MNKRLLSALLALCMMLTLFPASAFASADDTGGGIYPLTPAAQDTSPDEENGSAQQIEVSDGAGFIAAARQINAGSGAYEIVLQNNITLSESVEFTNAAVTITSAGGSTFTIRPIEFSDSIPFSSCLLSVNGGSLTLNSVKFESSAAFRRNLDYPFIRVVNSAALTLNNCILDGNCTSSSERCLGLEIGDESGSLSSVTMTDSTIQNCRTVNKFGAGAIVYNHSSLEMNNSHIQNCTNAEKYEKGSGGGIYVYSDGSVVMNSGSTLENCTAVENGGGVYLEGSATLTMNQSSLTGCEAQGNGGGVYLESSAKLIMDKSSLTSCEAQGNGGGVYVSSSASVTMNNSSKLENCTATGNGGGAYLNGYNSKLTLNSSTLTGCEAQGDGGGVYLTGYYAVLTMNNGQITGCKAPNGNGGGVFLAGSAGLTPKMKGSDAITGCCAKNGGGLSLDGSFYYNYNYGTGLAITGCSATQYGGGIYICPNSTASLDISTSLVYNNTADTAGDDLYMSAAARTYNVQLPSYTGKDLIHNKDSKIISDWYLDNEGARYAYDFPTQPLTSTYHNTVSSDATVSKGLIACSAVYNITFNSAAEAKHSVASSDASHQSIITTAGSGEKVYLTCENDPTAAPDSHIVWKVVTDSDRTVSVLHDDNGKAYFTMPSANITSKVIVSLTTEHKITVIGGKARNFSRVELPYAVEGTRFYLTCDNSSGFEKWVWDPTGRPDGVTDEDGRNFQSGLGCSFVMPDRDVTVWAVTEGNTYQVYVELPEGVDFTNSPVAVSVTGTAPETQAAARAGTAVTSANAGQTVSLTFDPASLPADCHKTFGSWVVKKAGENGEPITVTSPTSTTGAGFTMPASDVVVTFTLKDAEQPDTPDTPDMPSDGGSGDSGAGAVIAGAVIGAAGYLAGTHVWLNHLYGFIPENRIQLALALWNHADCPAPESTELYPDIDEDDDDAQAAARWCVEQGLMKDYHKTDKDGNEEVTFKPGRYVLRLQAIKAWYDLEKLLSEQQ